MDEKHYSRWKRICSITNKILDIITAIAVLFLLVYSTYCLMDNQYTVHQADAEKYEPFKPSEEDRKSFEELRAINSDIIGWLAVPDTTIDYPLVQAEDNSYYLNHDAEKRSSLTGSLYLDSNNKQDFSDFNTIIFGHHMDAEKMFGDLDKFLNKDFFDSHSTADIYYLADGEWQWHTCTVVSVIQCDANDSTLYTPNANSESFINSASQQALYQRDTGATGRYVELSTCQNQTTNGRTILLLQINEQ